MVSEDGMTLNVAPTPPKESSPAACAMSAKSSEHVEKTPRAGARLKARCAVSGAANCRRARTSCARPRAAIVPTRKTTSRRAAAAAASSRESNYECSLRPAASEMSAMRL